MHHLLKYIILVLSIIIFCTYAQDQQIWNQHIIVERLFEMFTSIKDIAVGYLILTKDNYICQSTPYTYKTLQYGALRYISGLLRKDGNVVGVWSPIKECFVKLQQEKKECVDYKIPEHTRICDYDIRLMFVSTTTPFKLLDDLEEQEGAMRSIAESRTKMKDLASYISDYANSDDNLEPVDRQDKLEKMKIQFFAIRGNLELELGFYRDDLIIYLEKDLGATVNFLENRYREIGVQNSLNDTLQQLLEMLRNLKAEKYRIIDLDEYKSIMQTIINLYNSVMDFLLQRWRSNDVLSSNSTVRIAEVHIMTKFLTYFTNTLILHSGLFEAYYWENAIKKCSHAKCTVDLSMTRDLSVQYMKQLFQIGKQYNTTAINLIHPCIGEHFDKVLLLESGITGNISENLQLTKLSLEWHQCILKNELEKSKILNLDFNTFTHDVNSWKFTAQSGQVFRMLNASGEITSQDKPKNDFKVSNVLRTDNIISKLPPLVLQQKEPPIEGRVFPEPPPPSPTREFVCQPGHFGPECRKCPAGTWSNDGYLHLCDNGPAGYSVYTKEGESSPNCAWKCSKPEHYRDGNSCRRPPIGRYLVNAAEPYLSDCVISDPIGNMWGYFTSSGLQDDPNSCNFMFRYIALGESQKTISRAFTIETWIKPNIEEIAKTVSEDPINGVAFGLVSVPNKLSFYLLIRKLNNTDTLIAKMELNDYFEPRTARSYEFSLSDQWMHLAAIADPQLSLITFTLNSAPVGTAFLDYNPSESSTEQIAIAGIHKTLEPSEKPPHVFRFLPARIYNVIIHSTAVPFELLDNQPNSISYDCGTGAQWLLHRCVKFCTEGAHINLDGTCVCNWGKYMKDGVCKPCTGYTAGSKFPRTKETDCECLNRYAPDENGICVLGKQPFPQPEVNLTEGSHPPNTKLVIKIPSTVIKEGNIESSYLRLNIRRDFESFLSEDIPITQLSDYEYHLNFTNNTGTYYIRASINQPGRLAGYAISMTIRILPRVPTPIIYPKPNVLERPMLLNVIKHPKTEVIYSLDGSEPYLTYSVQSPPVIKPGTTVKLYAKPLSEWKDVMESEMVSHEFKAVKNTTKEIPGFTSHPGEGKTNLFRWASSHPHLTFWIFFGLCVLAISPLLCCCWIMLSFLCMWHYRKKKNAKNAQRLLHHSGKKKKKIPKKKVQPLSKDKRCNSCKEAFAVYHCLDCNQACCRFCKECDDEIHSYVPEIHLRDRIMICDGKHCEKKIKKLLTVVRGRYLCSTCIKAEDIKLTPGTYKRVKLCMHCYLQEAIDCNENICNECHNRIKSHRCIRFINEEEPKDEKDPLLEPKRQSKPLPEIQKKSTVEHKPTAIVRWPFKGRNEIELSLEKGTVVTVEEKLTNDWWFVSCGNQSGYFPSSYLEEQS